MISRIFEVWTGAVDPEGEPAREIRIEFEAPVASPGSTDHWTCDLRIHQQRGVTVHQISGIDGLQAVLLAMQFAKSQLDAIATREGLMITFLGESDLFMLGIQGVPFS